MESLLTHDEKTMDWRRGDRKAGRKLAGERLLQLGDTN